MERPKKTRMEFVRNGMKILDLRENVAFDKKRRVADDPCGQPPEIRFKAMSLLFSLREEGFI